MKDQQEVVSQANKELQDALQTLESKINRAVDEIPELFADVTEETTDRLDHLISFVESQGGPSREETDE